MPRLPKNNILTARYKRISITQAQACTGQKNLNHLFRQRIRHVKIELEEAEDLRAQLLRVLHLIDGVLSSPYPEHDVIIGLRGNPEVICKACTINNFKMWKRHAWTGYSRLAFAHLLVFDSAQYLDHFKSIEFFMVVYEMVKLFRTVVLKIPVFKFGDDEGHEVGWHGDGLLVVVPNVLVSSFP